MAPHVAVRTRLGNLLPRGIPLSDHSWRERHRVILATLWLHVPAIILFAAWTGHGLLHGALEGLLVATLALAASVRYGSRALAERHVRATIAALGLTVSSALLTHLSGGVIEMHFHFFVMIALIALYQEWPPFLAAILFVALHHGVVGVLSPQDVYNHAGAQANPWLWAGIHALFIAAASMAALTTWKLGERSRLEALHAVSLHEATLEATTDAILVVDAGGEVANYNERFAATWGLPARDVPLRGVHLLDQVASSLARPEVLRQRAAQLASHPDTSSHDVLDLLDGRVVEADSRPQRVAGRTVGRVWSMRDVTQQRRAEEERLVSAERLGHIRRLEETDRFKTGLLNSVSHELNTPLTPLRLQVALLRGMQGRALAPGDPQLARSVDILDRNFRRLEALVKNVLDVARLGGNGMQLKRTPSDGAMLAAEAVQAFEGVAREKGVELALESPEPVPAEVDAPRVTQVLYNLVANAIRFTPAGGRVAVRASRESDALRVDVTDTGRGLRPEDHGRLFQPFSQVHAAGEGEGGTGLGLYISRGIVLAHGGTLQARSAGLGLGSTFSFTVPLQAPSPEPEGPSPDHSVTVYRSDEQLASEFADFAAPALRSGGSLIVIAERPHARRLRAALTRLAPPASWESRVEFLDAAATLGTFMDGARPDWERFRTIMGDRVASARAAGSGRVAAYGEMVAKLWREGRPDAALALEAAWNRLRREVPFELMCGYPASAFTGAQGAGDVEAQHGHRRAMVA